MKVLLVLMCAMMMACWADESGQYVPDGDEGRYVPDNSGQYVPDGSGRYDDDGTGRYQGEPTARFARAKSAGSKFAFSESRPRPAFKAPVVRAAPTPPPNVYTASQNGGWKIIRQSGDVDVDGYRWDYETENKIVAEESGKLYNVGGKDESLRSKGFFQYTGPDNVVYSIRYTADENGFVAEGSHLPTPPPLPEALARALSENRV